MNCTNRLKIGVSCALVASVWLAGCGSDDSTSGPTDPLDKAPPLAPFGLEGRWFGTSGFSAHWEANIEPDLQGYRVYVQAPGAQSFVPINASPLSRNRISWAAPDGAASGEYVIRVSAIDDTGNESALSAALAVSPIEDSLESVEQNSGVEEGGNGRDTTHPTPEPPTEGHDNPQDNDPGR